MKENEPQGVDVSFSYAPGKIILAGEHTVVYGYPAIAATLDRGVRMGIREKKLDSKGPVLKASGLGFDGDVRPNPEGEGPEVLRKALARLVELYDDRVTSLELVADSSIPAGRGLGSSAALSVSIIRGLNRFYGMKVSTEVEAEFALELEKVFHGNPSGIDHTVISTGGLIRYERGETKITVEKIPLRQSMYFAVGLAGPHAGTLQAVSDLKQRSKRHPAQFRHLFQGISQLVDEMQLAISEGRLASVGELMNMNQGYLNALGVSTPQLEMLCSAAREKGALGAKLTGAGGGGAVIALVDEDPGSIVEEFSSLGYMSFAAKCEIE